MLALARRWLPPVLHPSRLGAETLLDTLEAMWCRATPAIHEGQIRAALRRQDARPVLPTIACPTLVLCGDSDRWSPPQQHREIAAAIPGAHLAIVPVCGHMVSLEAPEAVNEEFRQWLARPA